MSKVAPCTDCGKTIKGRPRRGRCSSCYKRLLKTGDRVRVVYRGILAERLWARVDRSDPSGCWPWGGGCNDRGYGLINTSENGRHVLTHRLAYQLLVGPIPTRQHLDHTCHDPKLCDLADDCPHRRCCNPAHLVPKTAKANNLRSNSPSAKNAVKDECVNGHALTPDNIYTHPKRGTRHCRKCALKRTAEWATRNPENMRRRWNAAYPRKKARRQQNRK